MATLDTLTNLRAVPDEESYTGYTIEPDFTAYRGWAEVPEWQASPYPVRTETEPIPDDLGRTRSDLESVKSLGVMDIRNHNLIMICYLGFFVSYLLQRNPDSVDMVSGVVMAARYTGGRHWSPARRVGSSFGIGRRPS